MSVGRAQKSSLPRAHFSLDTPLLGEKSKRIKEQKSEKKDKMVVENKTYSIVSLPKAKV